MLTEMSGICGQLIPHITQVTSAGSDQLFLQCVLILKFSPEPGKQASLFQITSLTASTCHYEYSHKKIMLQIMLFDSCQPPPYLHTGFDL